MVTLIYSWPSWRYLQWIGSSTMASNAQLPQKDDTNAINPYPPSNNLHTCIFIAFCEAFHRRFIVFLFLLFKFFLSFVSGDLEWQQPTSVMWKRLKQSNSNLLWLELKYERRQSIAWRHNVKKLKRLIWILIRKFIYLNFVVTERGRTKLVSASDP